MLIYEAVAEMIDDRSSKILEEVIEQYILQGKPVGSRTVSKLSGFNLSPASIRNIMLELEESGFLYQPHTSAGRVPTDKGYRFYVDSILDKGTPQHQFGRGFPGLGWDVAEFPSLMEKTSKVLSSMSNQVGIVLAPCFNRTVFRHIEFVKLSGKRILAILITNLGIVNNKVISVDEELSQSELDCIGNFLVEMFGSKTLIEVRSQLIDNMAQEKAQYDNLLKNALMLGNKYFSDEDDESIFIDGTSNIFNDSEMTDIKKMKELFRTFEEKSKIVRILSRCIEDDGLSIIIGSENTMEDLQSMSCIFSTYKTGGGNKGILGIVGPKRMEYAKIIALVHGIADKLTKAVRQYDDN